MRVVSDLCSHTPAKVASSKRESLRVARGVLAASIAIYLSHGVAYAATSAGEQVVTFGQEVPNYGETITDFDESVIDFDEPESEFIEDVPDFDETTEFEEDEIDEDDPWLTPTLDLTAEIDAPTLNHCEGLMNHTDPIAVPPLNQPPRMGLFLDQGSQARHRRISDTVSGDVIKPIGNSAQSWSADEGLMILQHYSQGKAPKFVLMDGSNYQVLGTLNIPSVASDTIYWSQENPFSVLYVTDSDSTAGQLTRFDIASGSTELVKDFEPYCEEYGFTARGGLFTKPSSGDELFGYQCGASGDKSLAISYRYSSDEVHTLEVGDGSDWKLNLPPVANNSGDSFWFQGKVLAGTFEPIALDKSTQYNEAPFSVGTDSDSNDRIYQVADSSTVDSCNSGHQKDNSLVIERNMQTGDCIALSSKENALRSPREATSIFAGTNEAKDWLAMASIGYGEFENFAKATPAPTYFSEVYLVNKAEAANSQVCRLGHHRTFGKAANNADYDPVLGEPNITLSPSGTRVLYSSDWYDSGSVNTYVVELPTFTRLRLDGEWADNKRPSMITRFAQAGAKFNFSRSIVADGVKPSIVSTGTGRISGKRIDLNYTTTVANETVPGTCTASVQSNLDYIEFECDNEHLGDTKIDIIRQ